MMVGRCNCCGTQSIRLSKNWGPHARGCIPAGMRHVSQQNGVAPHDLCAKGGPYMFRFFCLASGCLPWVCWDSFVTEQLHRPGPELVCSFVARCVHEEVHSTSRSFCSLRSFTFAASLVEKDWCRYICKLDHQSHSSTHAAPAAACIICWPRQEKENALAWAAMLADLVCTQRRDT